VQATTVIEEVERALPRSSQHRSLLASVPGRDGEPVTRALAVEIALGDTALQGDLAVTHAHGPIVVFAHGSGSGRQSPRNRLVAQRLQQEGLGTLLLDLLTDAEEQIDERTARLRFDINLLATRLEAAVAWLDEQSELAPSRLGYFGASTGAGAALVAAARQGDRIGAVVSRGGRPDLAGDALPAVRAPTLLIVGGHDHVVLGLNREAQARLGGANQLTVVAGATHLFPEPGALEQVAALAAAWFTRHLATDATAAGRSRR
jgi:putative phosphoribosyl transferase